MKLSQSLHVAVVDDDPSICRSLERFLRACGMQPRCYDSAESFLADTESRYSCLLLDIQLGGMSGIELARELHTQGNRTPFIFITAFDDAETRSTAVALGCAGYFNKSVPGIEVVDAILRATD